MTALFAVVLGAVAWRRFAQASPQAARGRRQRAGHAIPCRLNPAQGRLHWNWACARSLLLAGSAAGFLSGLLGVGRGFMPVPTLLATNDLAMKAVVVTSMGVLALISAGGVLNASLRGQTTWTVTWPFAAGAVVGLFGGHLFAQRLAGPRLQHGFAVLGAAIAVGLLARATT